MMICKACNGTKIKTRLNYTHGRKSKSTASFSCKTCGSSQIEVKQTGFKDRKGRGRRQ